MYVFVPEYIYKTNQTNIINGFLNWTEPNCRLHCPVSGCAACCLYLNPPIFIKKVAIALLRLSQDQDTFLQFYIYFKLLTKGKY